MEAEHGNAISISEADHCDFEFPQTSSVQYFCQTGNENYSEQEIKSVILNLLHHIYFITMGIKMIQIYFGPQEIIIMMIKLTKVQLSSDRIKHDKYRVCTKKYYFHSNYPNRLILLPNIYEKKNHL
ncbi:MAG: hypothetical protein CM15mP87_06410 [Candidatus Neomarinimicrobiota bacterium]|nr:MAG: hypothetical protein CM15mP87_06410 [Candidatus Neomarinimicrobiota bacterium]